VQRLRERPHRLRKGPLSDLAQGEEEEEEGGAEEKVRTGGAGEAWEVERFAGEHVVAEGKYD